MQSGLKRKRITPIENDTLFVDRPLSVLSTAKPSMPLLEDNPAIQELQQYSAIEPSSTNDNRGYDGGANNSSHRCLVAAPAETYAGLTEEVAGVSHSAALPWILG